MIDLQNDWKDPIVVKKAALISHRDIMRKSHYYRRYHLNLVYLTISCIVCIRLSYCVYKVVRNWLVLNKPFTKKAPNNYNKT
jgi:hypothetical protein